MKSSTKKTSKQIIPTMLVTAFAVTHFGISQAQAYDWNTPQNQIPNTSNAATTVHAYKLPTEGSEARYGAMPVAASNTQSNNVENFFDAPRVSKLDPLDNEASRKWAKNPEESTPSKAATTRVQTTRTTAEQEQRARNTTREQRRAPVAATVQTDELRTAPAAQPAQRRPTRERVAQVSADDQARSSQRETDITRMIRSEIMEKDLSTNAKNVTIVTLNGRVHLRGTVETAAEKAELERIARNISKMNVINETVISE